MPERCPLSLIDSENASDTSGIFWDTGIPQGCWNCINQALLRPTITEYFIPELESDESIETIETYVATGILPHPGTVRTAIQEVGIDSAGTNEGSLLSKVVSNFRCEKT
jgi:hypothetical protein